MTRDFRAVQIQTNKIISSGSTGTGAKLILYDISSEDTSSPNQGVIDPNIFNTSSIGTDIFLYVSGAIGDKDSSNQSISVFGGDLHISGNLTVDGTSPGGSGDTFFFSTTNEIIEQSGSLQMSGSGLFKSGLTGALNELPDGSPFLNAGTDITLSTGSNGQITINSTAGGGATLQSAYNLGNSITASTTTSSLTIVGSAGQDIPLLRMAPSDSEETALAIYNSTNGNANRLLLLHGSDSSFGRAGLILRSQGDISSVISWQTAAPSKTSGSNASIFYHESPNKLKLQCSVSGGAVSIVDTAATGESAVFVNGTALGFGSIYLLPAKTNGIVYNSGSLINLGRIISKGGILSHPTSIATISSFGTDINNFFSGSIGGRNTISSSISVFGGDLHISGNLSVDAGGIFRSGLTGALNELPDGSSFLNAGLNITLSTGSNGQITINAAGTGSVDADWVYGNGAQLRTTSSIAISSDIEFAEERGSDTYFFVSGAIGGKDTIASSVGVFGGDLHVSGNLSVAGLFPSHFSSNTAEILTQSGSIELSGSGLFKSGLTGALNELPDGSPYLNAGTNITLVTASNGQITINSTGGGGGSDTNWTLTGSTLYSTSSIVIGEQTKATDLGSDIFFFVSGTFGSGSSDDAISVFGGDVRISGTLAVGTGSSFIKENSITFTSASIRNIDNELRFFDINNLTGVSLQQLNTNLGFFFSDTNEIIEQSGSLQMSGSGLFKSGLTGALNELPDGAPYLLAGSNITLTTGSNGQITIESAGAASTDTDWIYGDGAQLRTTSSVAISSDVEFAEDHGTDIYFFVSGSIGGRNTILSSISTFGGDTHISGNLSVDGLFPSYFSSNTADILVQSGSLELSGSGLFKSGLTGALNELPDGSPFLNAGTNITLSTGSNGQITINSTDGGTDTDWTLTGSTLYSTSSIVVGIENKNTDISQDVFFFVSGAIGDKDSSNQSISVFGGDLHISGNLTVDGTSPGGSGDNFFFSTTNEIIEQSGSLQMSGSGLFKSGLTGALNELPDGSPYLTAGTNITLSTGSNGQITINSTGVTPGTVPSSSFRISLVNYTSTNATSSNPHIAGQTIFDLTEYTGSVTLRAVLSNTGITTTSSIKLLNITSGAYVEIGGSGIEQLNSVGSTPTIVTSSNLRESTNFSTGSAIYELQLITDDIEETAYVGGGEIITFVQIIN